jgi:hypothetical protein
MPQDRHVLVLSAVRTAIGKYGGAMVGRDRELAFLRGFLQEAAGRRIHQIAGFDILIPGRRGLPAEPGDHQ